MSVPVIAIVGRPNVGKSTLFNRLTKTRNALVADLSGLTRDRQYGEGKMGDKPFIVIDTGGIGEESQEIENIMTSQAKLAISEADHVLFMVDGRQGLTPADENIAEFLRSHRKPVSLVVNKTDGLDIDIACGDFYKFGFSKPYAIAATHGRGVTQMLDSILESLPETEEEILPEDPGIRLAIVGRPNVGKSTLVNRMLGEERVIVYDMPGTTRDSIYIPLERRGQRYTLIDTAGVRRRGRVYESVEKFSVVKTLQAIESSDVVLVLFDAQEGVSDQDLHLLGFVIDAGKALVIAINKWDGLGEDQKDKVKRDLDRRLDFVDFAKTRCISALHGTAVGDLFPLIEEAYECARRKIHTPKINELLGLAVESHQPPLIHGRRIKLRYAHAGGQMPPLIVIHGNQTDAVPLTYKRYLANFFRKHLKIYGTPIRIEFVSNVNPFADKKNELTPRQKKHRQRLKDRFKKK